LLQYSITFSAYETVDRGQKQIILSVVYFCHKPLEVNKTIVLLKVSESGFYVIFSYCSKKQISYIFSKAFLNKSQ